MAQETEMHRKGSRTAGFTLVEMLIALILAGLVAGGVMTLLLRQNTFYGKNDDTIYAEQTMRGTAELVASELRMVSPGVNGTNTDFLVAKSDSLQVRFDAIRAVVCGNDGSSHVYLYVYDLPTAPNLPAGRGTAVSKRDQSWFRYLPAFNAAGTQATNSSSLSYTICLANNGGVPQSTDLSRYRNADWSGSGELLPDSLPPEGAVVRVFGQLTYSFAPSSFTSGTALWRNDQELVAPFASGAHFEYVMRNGTVQSSVSSVDFPNIRRIRISATATGSGSNRYDVSRDLSFDISVRNL